MYLLFGWQGIRHRYPRYSTLWATPELWVLNLLRRDASPPQIGPYEFRRSRANVARWWERRPLRRRLQPAHSIHGRGTFMKGRVGGFKPGASD